MPKILRAHIIKKVVVVVVVTYNKKELITRIVLFSVREGCVLEVLFSVWEVVCRIVLFSVREGCVQDSVVLSVGRIYGTEGRSVSCAFSMRFIT